MQELPVAQDIGDTGAVIIIFAAVLAAAQQVGQTAEYVQRTIAAGIFRAVDSILVAIICTAVVFTAVICAAVIFTAVVCDAIIFAAVIFVAVLTIVFGCADAFIGGSIILIAGSGVIAFAGICIAAVTGHAGRYRLGAALLRRGRCCSRTGRLSGEGQGQKGRRQGQGEKNSNGSLHVITPILSFLRRRRQPPASFPFYHTKEPFSNPIFGLAGII